MGKNRIGMESSICANCQFWDRDGQPESDAINAKRCRYAVHTVDATEWNEDYDRVLKDEFKETKAFVCDASGYLAIFYTKEDFSCNQHKEIKP